ncbi:hypothetical protein CBM2587_A110073 [Cupriavidus taiwanensis]|uniref:Uncharacterized protein n=1 Tax=Cupriavidus taiwanensis TaxID=164546 RepID=A0A375BG27_9BURK|nr:hypothetical protein CBM2587_A110073 [Cupriavidus taiwanensis]
MRHVKPALSIECYTCRLDIDYPALNFAPRAPIASQYRRREFVRRFRPGLVASRHAHAGANCKQP